MSQLDTDDPMASTFADEDQLRIEAILSFWFREQNLEIGRVKQVIEWCDDRGIATRGFFMVGFPTETPAEMAAPDQPVSAAMGWARTAIR